MRSGDHASIVVPDGWRALDLASLSGVLIVIGASNTGKSTFAHWLFRQLARSDRPVAFLDGDVGQSALGPPTLLTLGLATQTSEASEEFTSLLHWFVGDVSPRGHMLPWIVGVGRLTQRALATGAKTIVVDTTGLVDRAQGGVALKHALVDQLQPTTLFAFQRAAELEPILAPLRRLPSPRVVELPVTDRVRQRDVQTRQAHRAAAFRRYFAGAGSLRLSLRTRAVFEGQAFAPRRLLALQDRAGLTLALGVILDWEPTSAVLTVQTPWTDPEAVASVRLGVLGVDVNTGRELRPGRSG